MKRFFVGALVASALAFPASAALKVGDKAPSFKAPASLKGKAREFSLDAALKKGPVVVYFYPAAFTRDCSVQAHAFAEAADKFAAAKTTIIGVSGDNIEKLNAFSADPAYCAGKFAVASDPQGAIAKSYALTVDPIKPNLGRPTSKDLKGNPVDIRVILERTTFVITPDHKIISVLRTKEDALKMEDHAAQALTVVQGLSTKKG